MFSLLRSATAGYLAAAGLVTTTALAGRGLVQSVRTELLPPRLPSSSGPQSNQVVCKEIWICCRRFFFEARVSLSICLRTWDRQSRRQKTLCRSHE